MSRSSPDDKHEKLIKQIVCNHLFATGSHVGETDRRIADRTTEHILSIQNIFFSLQHNIRHAAHSMIFL